MAAISPTGNIQMLGALTDADVASITDELTHRDPGTILAVADSEKELEDLARTIRLGHQERERRAARRKQQKASRRANR